MGNRARKSVLYVHVFVAMATILPLAGPAWAAPSNVAVIQSSPPADRWAAKNALQWGAEDGSALPTLTVYGGTNRQQIEGFGGALTESVAILLQRDIPSKRTEILTKLFHPTQGLAYNFARTHINSCDFSTTTYSYDDVDGDFSLSQFDIVDDVPDLIPLIQAAKSIAGPSLRVFAAPWSAPAWMKESGEMLGGGELRGVGPVRDQYEDVWARYLLKYLQAYSSYGIDLYAISAQNEPTYDPAWEGLQYTPEQLRDFIRDHLGPTLAAGGYGNVKIIAGDGQKSEVMDFAKVIYGDSQAAGYVWGIAGHWYTGDYFEEYDEAAIRYPTKIVFSSEATEYPGAQVGEWDNATKYAHSVIGDINNGAIAWVDWNVALDTNGGPYKPETPNPCSATITVNVPAQTYTLNTQYYALGHFSRHVKRGAYRIGSIMSGSVRVEATAFKNPSGQIVVVIYNSNQNPTQIKIKDGANIVKPTLPGLSITTFLYTNSNNALHPAAETIALRALDSGQYVTNPNNGNPLFPSGTSVGNAQRFYLYYKPDGFVTLKSALGEKYARVDDFNERLVADAETASTQIVPNLVNPFVSFERYELIRNADGTVSFKALKNGKYVQSDGGTGPLEAQGNAIGSWEKFVKVPQP